MVQYFEWRPYVPVAQRRRNAARHVAALRKQGLDVDPVVIEGRRIACTFWGKAWCDHLECHCDFANRLPRGRTYVRNGSVVDLQIAPGEITAIVSGSSIYEVCITIEKLAKTRWRSLVAECAGKIDSVIELLAGELSGGVMKVLARDRNGLFPRAREMSLDCSCPDGASMCKHVAAVLYGVGARLDREPELLFALRDVDALDLVARVGTGAALSEVRGSREQVLDADGLEDIFGIELEKEPPETERAPKSAKKVAKRKARRNAKKTTGKARRGRKRSSSREITARELIERGVPRSTFQNWVRSGVLRRTRRRGVYRTTATTEERIQKALRRR